MNITAPVVADITAMSLMTGRNRPACVTATMARFSNSSPRRRKMKTTIRVMIFAAIVITATPDTGHAADQTESIVLAGGCFWGMESVFDHTKGVIDATVGFAGGNADTAHYETVSTGTTGHAESVKVTFDPQQVSLSQLLDIYFKVAHDPTELNYQGPDHGTQYRSTVFYATP